MANFLWRGHSERLPFDELHSPQSKGGLGLPCLQTRLEALLTKQYCHFPAGSGRVAAHLTLWLGEELHP